MNEQDPNGKSAKEPGSKLDAGKAPIMQGVIQYFPRAVKAVAMLSQHGADKYAWKGWETVPDGINRYGDAAMRHAVDEEIQGHYDLAWKEQGIEVLHATAVAWNALAKLELLIRQLEKPAEGGKTVTFSNPQGPSWVWDKMRPPGAITWLSEALETVKSEGLLNKK